jgi:acetyl esterase/lipase
MTLKKFFMKNRILFFLSFLIFQFCFLQFPVAQTAEAFKRKGDSLYNTKDFKNSALAYSSSIRLLQSTELDRINNTRWAAACSWSLGNIPDSAFIYLNQVADSKDLTFSFFLDITSDEDFSPLYKEKRWGALKEKMFTNAKKTFLSMLIQKAGERLPNPELISAAMAWTLFNKDSAFYYLQMLTNTKELFFRGYNNVSTNSIFEPLRNDSRWQPLIETLYKKFETTFTTPHDSTYTQEEIIYGRKDGMALTLIHLKPKFNSNHKSIIQVMSGSWWSSIRDWNYNFSLPFLQKGYSIFVVAQGSIPVYSIADEVADLQRAIRFIRYKANKFEIDANKIGITGGSSGGHLSLLCAVLDSVKNQTLGDPYDRVSSKVQAVVSYFPPTDFLNWGAEGDIFFNSSVTRQNPRIKVIDTVEWKNLLKDFSPLYHVSANDAPALILHGDNDDVVPIRQAQTIVQKLQDAKVPVSLFVKKGAGHGWQRDDEEIKMVIDWFDKYLK